jgi:iron-sulfur cluster assembly accessory protein
MQQHLHLDIPPHAAGDFRLELTPGAIEMARSLMQRRGLADGALRVSVSGGGCSGFQYGLAVDEQQRPDDLVIDYAGVRVFVDPQSAAYLNGVTIDYVDALHGAGFKFINPNANRTCGCGSSFSV